MEQYNLSLTKIELRLNLLFTLKVLISIGLGYLVVYFDPDPHAVWILITIAIISMSHISVTLQITKAFARLLGTAIGAVLGILLIIFHFSMAINIAILILVSLLFCYLRLYRHLNDYAALLGLITFFMIVVPPHSTWIYGVERAGDIMLGILISLTVSLLIFPQRPDAILRLYLEKNWLALCTYADNILIVHYSRYHDSNILDQEYILLKQQGDMNSILRAPNYLKFYKINTHLKQLARLQLGIYRYLTMLDCLLHEKNDYMQSLPQNTRSQMASLHKDIVDYMRNINVVNISQSLQRLSLLLEQINQANTTNVPIIWYSLLFGYKKIFNLLQAINDIVINEIVKI